MIKVNLLLDHTEEKVEGTMGQMSYAEVLKRNKDGGPIKLGIDVPPAAKLLIIALPMILLFGFEKYKNNANNKAMGSLVTRHESIKQQREQRIKEAEGIRDLEAELKANKALLAEFRKIDEERLLPIRVLDNLQDILPFQVWLTTVDLSRVSINVNGVSVSENDLTQFQQNLDDSPFFRNILIYNSVEQRSEAGRYVSFKLRANVGNAGEDSGR